MYISVAEAKEYLWVTWDDTLIENLIKKWETAINNTLQYKSFETANYEEEHRYKWNWPYYLKQVNPTSLIDVDGASIQWSYKLEWRKLRFEIAPNLIDTIWNTITIKYTAWFDTIPTDIKETLKDIVKIYYRTAKSSASVDDRISSLEQWSLKVAYKDKDPETEKQVQLLIKTNLKHYIKNLILW